jgi:chromosome segregation ATPase
MNFLNKSAYPQSQQQEIQTLDTRSQYSQAYNKAAIEVSIKELDTEIELFEQNESEFAAELPSLSQKISENEAKLQRLQRIADFSQKFQQLQQEFQDDRELLDALYVSIFSQAE